MVVCRVADTEPRPPTGLGRWGYAAAEGETSSQTDWGEMLEMEEDSLGEEEDDEEMDEEDRDQMLQDLKGIW